MSGAATHLFAGCAVADLAAALPFYEAVFGRPADLEPHDGERCWRLEGSGGGLWINVLVDAARAGGSNNTVLVADLDWWLAGWSARGVAVASIEAVGGGRKATLVDPDGNALGFAQVPGGD
jgi:predicted enzyme related to lactoylglutathione lyase